MIKGLGKHMSIGKIRTLTIMYYLKKNGLTNLRNVRDLENFRTILIMLIIKILQRLSNFRVHLFTLRKKQNILNNVLKFPKIVQIASGVVRDLHI